MDKASVSFTVNGRAVAATLDPRTLLVHFLREELKLTGTHIGCDTSQCGASWRATSAGARAIATSSRPSPPAPGRCGPTRAGAKRAAKGRGMYPFTTTGRSRSTMRRLCLPEARTAGRLRAA